MLVQRIEQAVTETPEEEQDCDETDGVYRPTERQLGRRRCLVVGDTERPALPEAFGEHDIGVLYRPHTLSFLVCGVVVP